jgi:hypothetical protein
VCGLLQKKNRPGAASEGIHGLAYGMATAFHAEDMQT